MGDCGQFAASVVDSGLGFTDNLPIDTGGAPLKHEDSRDTLADWGQMRAPGFEFKAHNPAVLALRIVRCFPTGFYRFA